MSEMEDLVRERASIDERIKVLEEQEKEKHCVKVVCPCCRGVGEIETWDLWKGDFVDIRQENTLEDCAECNGAGYIFMQPWKGKHVHKGVPGEHRIF